MLLRVLVPSECKAAILLNKRAATQDFQQCGMCDQQIIRSAGAYEHADQSLLVASDVAHVFILLINVKMSTW